MHERRVGRGGDAARGEVRHRQLALAGDVARPARSGAPSVLGLGHQLARASTCRAGAMLAAHRAHVAHRLDDVAGAGLALGADHRRALADAAQRLAEVAAAAHERHLEVVLVDVVLLVGRGEHLALVDEVHAERLEHLRLGEVADAALGHHRDRDRLHDLLDLLDRGHARHAALGADVGRHALERHHRDRARVLGDLGLLGVGDVHDDAALEHLGEADLHAKLRRLEIHVFPPFPRPPTHRKLVATHPSSAMRICHPRPALLLRASPRDAQIHTSGSAACPGASAATNRFTPSSSCLPPTAA